MTLRAAVHVHSNWSYDGQWALEKISDTFATRGYDLVLMTEHDLGFSEEKWRDYREACREVSSDRIQIIPGIEYSDPTNTVHILVWGLTRFLGAGRETGGILEEVTGEGGVCVLAHPSRKFVWRTFKREWVTYLSAIEIWNRKSDGWSPSAEAARLVSETGAAPIVGLDFHNAKQFFPLSVCFEFEKMAVEKEIIEAIRGHSFFNFVFGLKADGFTSGIGKWTTGFLESGRRIAARSARAVGLGHRSSKPFGQSRQRADVQKI